MGVARNPKRWVAHLLIAVGLFVVSSLAAHAVTRVLMVFQDDGHTPANSRTEQSVVSTLRQALGPSLEFYTEQLESTRFPEFREQTLASVRSRYADRKIDLVIYEGNIPTEILAGIPIVYITNSSEGVEGDAKSGNSTMLQIKVDVRKTIEVASRLQPKVSKVLVISGVSPSDLAYLEEFRRQLQTLQPQFEIELVTNATVNELLARVSQLPRDTIVLPIQYSRDPAGQNNISRDVVAMLAKASTVPVYAVSDTYIGTGVVGGYVVSWARTGEVAAEMGVEILHGADARLVSAPAGGTALYMFDWRQLKRWGFPESELPNGSVVEFKLPSAWEQYRWRIVGVVALLVLQTVLIIGLLIARKKRKRAEELLREMTGQLLQSQDDERRRIARDLHDGTGQHLSGMALTIGQVLADFPPGYEQLRRLLQDSHVASRKALNEVRTVSYVLHPPILDGLGLVPALCWYLEGLQKRSPIRIDFEAPAEIGQLSPEADRALFRMVQEGVTNVLRHSGGTELKVRLTSGAKEVRLEIQDNGHGLSAEQSLQNEGAAMLGVGIAGMRERIRQLNGEFTLQSSSDGTRVIATVPLDEKRNAAHHAG